MHSPKAILFIFSFHLLHSTFEWTDGTLRPMYRLFVGDNDKIPEDQRRQPADLRIKINLLPYLHKLNSYCWPECIQVRFQTAAITSLWARQNFKSKCNYCLIILRSNRMAHLSHVILVYFVKRLLFPSLVWVRKLLYLLWISVTAPKFWPFERRNQLQIENESAGS